jgi:hypothetical protein
MNALVGLVLPLAPLIAVPAPDWRDAPPRPSVLTNTTWIGVDNEWLTTYRFEPGGVLFYSYSTGTYRNGTWKVDGRTLYFQINDRFYEFRGMIDDDTIIGDAWNIRGDRWRHFLRRSR